MEINIKGILFRGKTIRQETTMSEDDLSLHLGLNVFKDYPHPCTRCKGTFFYLAKDGDSKVVFCGNQDCLNEDKAASIAMKREDEARRKEKNQSGEVITGSEYFSMGSDYTNACLATWNAHDSIQRIVHSWTKNDQPFLVVSGNTGTSKTYLCASVLNYFFEKKEEVFYTTHRRFVEEMHRAIEQGKSAGYVCDKFSQKKYLIIDDLGAATCTDWQKQMILDLIDARDSDRKKTLITTNFNDNAIFQYLGDRTASRILAKRNAKIELVGRDRRR